MIASASTYPHEVARTRLRELVDGKCRYTGLFNCFSTIVKEEGNNIFITINISGWRALYGGMGTHLMRTVPNTGLMFLTYEFVVNFVNKKRLAARKSKQHVQSNTC